MEVPLLDLKAQYASIRYEIEAAVRQVFESQHFVLGQDVREFENEISEYSQTQHAIGCASGSDALLLAMMAIDVKPGDEIITTPFTFFATAGMIARLGARPVFVDINPSTYNINPASIEGAITDRTRAIMPVHLYGQCAEMDTINKVAARHGLVVIEDAAQAIGAEDRRRRAGSMGTIGCFSFYPTKNLGGAGDGGMLVTNSNELAEKLRVLRVHGGEQRYFHRVIGINSRLDSLQAAVLRVKLKYLDQWTEARQRNAENYNRLFADGGLLEQVGLPFIREDASHIFHQYVIRVARRDELMAHLKQNGIGADIYYPLSLHQQECFGYLGYSMGSFPESERAASEVLALPIYPELSSTQQEYVVDQIREFYQS